MVVIVGSCRPIFQFCIFSLGIGCPCGATFSWSKCISFLSPFLVLYWVVFILGCHFWGGTGPFTDFFLFEPSKKKISSYDLLISILFSTLVIFDFSLFEV